VFRVYVWSERLALIELGVSVAIPVFCVLYNDGRRRRLRAFINMMPLIAVPLLLGYFGFAEYFRSWQSDFYQGKRPFWEFVAGRLASYYYTSLNNGAGMMETQNWPTYKFEYSLAFALKAPAMLGPLFKYYVGGGASSVTKFLMLYGDEEFNNPSGIYSIFMDVGVPGALIYFATFGFLCGVLYRALIAGHARGVVLYPLFFIALLEMYRYPYLGESRSFTALIGAGVALYFLSKRKRLA
jgi:hypothetical protein